MHGDDFTAVGTRSAIDIREQQLKAIVDLETDGRLNNELDTQTKLRLQNTILWIN